ncbi:4-hydroxyphenylpyruvate dioxygenase [Brachypodium distachyon]|uniref:VOC domain-containing protein n=1 Tax=Brachypodium distachyon TaxID=15368 RepID=I1IJR8_BRADI|nr:4-hydroxyphenylpyruvate dioxygenase [Brachypodium distachyon]KQJ87482.1 hypothetical protein BRADI_4g11450v3 [Brachypodium distachyon]|eukprot:XP_003575746.1 4-hydroxyphenylpyruvate dioxygenase [Brachypodium distachyon]
MMNAAVHTQYQALASSAFHTHLLPSSKLSSIRSRPRLARRLPIQALKTTHRPNAVATVVAPLERSSSSAASGLTILPSTVDNRLRVIDFHHAEFWCADAASAAARFSSGLGVPVAARSDLSMGNTVHASHLLRSSSPGSSIALLFTAPYADAASSSSSSSSSSTVPSFSADAARAFTAAHGGLAVRTVAVRVADAAEAYHASVEAGARPAFAPVDLGHGFLFAEVELYGDSVLRFVSYPDDTEVPFLPGFENLVSSSSKASEEDYGLTRFDHIVGNVPDLGEVANYIAGFTGFHRFFEFTTEEVGTEESGLNGVVLSEGFDTVLLTVIEPAHGTKRRSQVQTYLDHHGGPGVQHLAMASDDLLATLRKIRARPASMGGFEFLPTPPPSYYDGVRRRIGDVLSEAQIKECEELGVMVDRGDDDGVVLQIFTKPVGDRPTLLLEFIQRIGCMGKDENGKQRGACGGFARGNTTDFIKAYEDYDKTLDAPAPSQTN